MKKSGTKQSEQKTGEGPEEERKNRKINSPKLRALLDRGRGMMPPSFDRTPMKETNMLDVAPPMLSEHFDPGGVKQHNSKMANMSAGELEDYSRSGAIDALGLISGGLSGALAPGMADDAARMGSKIADDLLPPPAAEGVLGDELIQNMPVVQFPPPARMGPDEMRQKIMELFPQNPIGAYGIAQQAKLPPRVAPELSGSNTAMTPTMNMRPPPGPAGMAGDELLQNQPVFLDPAIRNHIAPPMGESNMMGALENLNAVNPVGAQQIQRQAMNLGQFNRPASGSLETPPLASGSVMQQGNAQLLRHFNSMTPEQQMTALMAALGVGGATETNELPMLPPSF